MKILLLRLLLALGLILLAGGCASVDSSVDSGRSLQSVQRYFILSNPNDNRAIDHQIAMALKARGGTAETGPLTMMPDDTQAVITYQDHWAWDFGEYLDHLSINVSDPPSGPPYARASYSIKVPGTEKSIETVNRLVAALLAH
jgi:hypothetical protein